VSDTSTPAVAPTLATRLVEALVFASSEPVSERAMLELLQGQHILPDAADAADAADAGGEAVLSEVLEALQALYIDRGVRPVRVAGGWQFRTAADLAPFLTRVMHRPRRLPRSAMETLSVIAYHQPCTRTEVEAIRGVSLSQATLDALLEAALITPKGRKEVPGRPVLWGTSQDFLRHFGLRDLRDLPRREELLVELPHLGQRPVPEDSPHPDEVPVPVPAAPEAC